MDAFNSKMVEGYCHLGDGWFDGQSFCLACSKWSVERGVTHPRRRPAAYIMYGLHHVRMIHHRIQLVSFHDAARPAGKKNVVVAPNLASPRLDVVFCLHTATLAN